MAAYGALVSLMNDLELIPNHPTHSFSFDNKQLASLSQTVHFLIDFMETYDSHGCTREVAEVLESRIASAAHVAHDVIESHVVDQIHAGCTLGGKATPYFLPDLQKAIEDMELVKIEAEQFNSKSRLIAEQPTYSTPTSSQALTSEKNLMVGFDALVSRLMEIVVGGPSSRRVIPIVGMGGMGKTTLAKNVYECSYIKHHFDLRIWATISQEYSLVNILTELLFGERKFTRGNVSELGEELYKKLWGRRYLVVLDDMWSEEAWDKIRMFLPHDSNGSCVIVTSRLSNLAAHLSSSPFVMNFLDEEKSWELFCGNAFGEEDCPIELEKIGKNIVKRCGGLPLSIVVIGGHLRRSSRAIEYWEKVANNMNPISSLGADDQCLNIISLSYEHLPACLKPCFLFMGIFGEDAWIRAPCLLQSWIAEGFLKPNKSQSLEEVAEDYLNDLIDRNLILVRERRWNGKVEGCGIHDIVRELCLKVGKKEKFMCVLEDIKQAIDRERRIVIPKWKKLDSDMFCALESAPLLRSLKSPLCSKDVLVEMGLLRVFDVNSMILNKDGASLQQVNLRYLAFSCHKFTCMSSFIKSSYHSSFWNMQTLIIGSSGQEVTAPYEIWEMSQLRYLLFGDICLPDPVPVERSNQQERVVLRNLHTLEVNNLRLTEEVCKRIPNIKVLKLSYYDFPSDDEASSYYCLGNLGCFNRLESFKCFFGGGSQWRDVIRSFTFPSLVEELCLENGHLYWEDLTMMIKSLPNLGSLQLSNVKGPKWDLVGEEFPSLKKLKIVACSEFMYWNANSSHFPVLEILDISHASKLSEIPFDIGEIPTLRLIQLSNCSESVAVSAMKIMMEQESFGNEDLRLDVHFWKRDEAERLDKLLQELDLTSKSLSLHGI